MTYEDDRQALVALRLATYSKRMSDGHTSVIVRTNDEAADIVLAEGFRRHEPGPATDAQEALSHIAAVLAGAGVLGRPEVNGWMHTIDAALETTRSVTE